MEVSRDTWETGQEYLDAFDVLIGDIRTGNTFRGIVHGIIGGESLRAPVIARFPPRTGRRSVR